MNDSELVKIILKIGNRLNRVELVLYFLIAIVLFDKHEETVKTALRYLFSAWG